MHIEKPSWVIEWSDALSMANKEIDAEHQNFIRLVNDLNHAIADPQRDKADIERILNLILEDAIAHFSHEERLFVENNYPGAEKHEEIHTSLINKFENALKVIQSTEFSKEWIEVGMEIKDLLVDHVVNEDSKYIEYLRTE